MALQINLTQERRNNSTNYGKIYGRAKNSAPIGIEDLADVMKKHNQSFSKGEIQGIITDMASTIKELLLLGQPVKLADLGIFYASVESKPANTVKEFDLGTHIKSVKLLCRATGQLTRKELTKDSVLEYTELAKKLKDGLISISSLYKDNSDEDPTDGDDPDTQRP